MTAPTRIPTSILRVIAPTALCLALVACGGDDGQPAGPTIPPDAEAIVEQSAAAMGEVTSVRFALETDGEPVYIDGADAIELQSLEGRFEEPGSADALVQVRVAGALSTELAAVAIDDEVWLSNPVTGDLEPLPPGVELDPSDLFDPQGGWQPLLAELQGVELVGIEDRDGERYHVRGIAPATQVEVVTAGLVEGIDLPVDLWIDPATAHVTVLEFMADLGDGPTQWVLELSDYGEDFDITPPPDG